jgi:hypothetical protein
MKMPPVNLFAKGTTCQREVLSVRSELGTTVLRDMTKCSNAQEKTFTEMALFDSEANVAKP